MALYQWCARGLRRSRVLPTAIDTQIHTITHKTANRQQLGKIKQITANSRSIPCNHPRAHIIHYIAEQLLKVNREPKGINFFFHMHNIHFTLGHIYSYIYNSVHNNI